MVRRSWTVVFLLTALLALSGCGELHPPGKRRYVVYHTVHSGETLYSIAWSYGYDYREVAAWNRIRAPYRIFVGQRLLIIPPSGGVPVEDHSSGAAASAAPAPGSSENHAPAPPRKTTHSVAVEKPVSRPHQVSIRWHWPTSGKVVRNFADSGSKKGVDIGGRLGQPVYAAAAGDVVYSGSGLVGYGNLVIIKHDDVFLSAYGQNRRLLVKEGDRIKAGQMIAEMGQTGKDGAILHFEIRQDGRPVDPMRYLPRQTN